MLSKDSSGSSFHVGNRICSDSELATIKFIGEIESQEGTWLGVEWDNPSRGKHSGTYKNVTYFQTSIENAGSFIRAWKVESGISCPEAVKRKYGLKGEKDSTNSIDLPQKSGHVRAVEMIGFEKVAEKQSQFKLLMDVMLSSMNVIGPGDPGELTELLPVVVSLDLSCNPLDSWSQVADIVKQLPQLQALVLSKNRLKVENDLDTYKEAFNNLKTLVLNDCGYDWSDIITCGAMWPNIENLYVSKNSITELEIPPSPVLSNLLSINLDENVISSWDEVLKLGSLSSLQELCLNGCQLEVVSFPGVHSTEKTNLFPSLNQLYLCSNRLSRWQHIAELSKLRNLKVLRITNNLVMSSVTHETARQLVIAKLLSLERLNRTEVTKSERRGAEFDYIKRYHREWFKNGGQKDISSSKPSEDFMEEHPTYIRLLQIHGSPEESEIASKTSVLKNNLLSLHIFSSIVPTKPPFVKKLPATMPVCKVKGLIQRLYNVSAQDLKLICISANGVDQGMEMDNDLRQLSFYSICDGDKIDVRW